MPIDWDREFATDVANSRATETDTARAERLGVTVTSVRKQRVRRGIAAAVGPGRPASGKERVGVAFTADQLARLDAFAQLRGIDREDALTRILTSGARAILNGKTGERTRYDRLLKQLLSQ